MLQQSADVQRNLTNKN